MARNSAPSSTNRPAALKKARIRNSTACTGFFTVITMKADATQTPAKRQKNSAESVMRRARPSPIRCVEGQVLGDLALPAVAIRKQPLLVVIELLARLGGELEVRPLDDGVDRAGFLAKAAIDAFHHVNVVSRGAARAVVAARACFDGDRLRRAASFAPLAGDAALFAVGITPQRMLSAESRRERAALERVIDGRLGPHEIFHGEPERRDELGQQQGLGAIGKALHNRLLSRPMLPKRQDGRYDDDHGERQWQEDLPPEPHQLVVAVTGDHGLDHGNQEEQEANLPDEPYHTRNPSEGRDREQRQPAAEK